MTANVLITGGAGFIGSNFVEYYFQEHPQDKVIVFDKLTYAGRLENLEEFKDKKNFHFVKGDICDSKKVNETFKKFKPEIVLNFAAESHVDRSIKDASSFIKTDVLGTFELLEASRKFDVKKFVQISTDEVYGQILEGSFTEESPLTPRNPYSASKAGADRLAYSYFTTYSLPVLITRSSNNFGPKHFPEKVIPLFITNLLRGKKVPLYGEGKQIRDWLFVKDNCKAIDIVLEKGGLGEVYNIGGNYELPNIELTRKILSAMGFDESMIQKVPDRLGHDFRYSLDCSKMHALGWNPEHDFDTALHETIEWYKSNKEWWKPLLKHQL